MTLTHAYVWVKWVREMIIDFGFPEWVEQPTVILTDNRNARDWSNESMITDGNRHIDRRYMLIREKVKLGQIATVWMSGDWNISDVGTKAIDVPTTERLTPLLAPTSILYKCLAIPSATRPPSPPYIFFSPARSCLPVGLVLLFHYDLINVNCYLYCFMCLTHCLIHGLFCQRVRGTTHVASLGDLVTHLAHT